VFYPQAAVYMIRKRRGIAIGRKCKRMVYQTTVQEEKYGYIAKPV
jgi:hypothetical protein